MTRPSRNLDQRLIEAALELLPETGFSGLKLRQVAQKAGVNLGMFNYHFKGKQDFSERVLREVYENFFNKFSLEISKGETPSVQLRQAWLHIARFMRENRQLFLSFLRDALSQNQSVIFFVEQNFHRHILILVDLVRQCQKQKVIANYPLPMALVFLGVSTIGPLMVTAILERVRLKTQYEWIKKLVIPFLINDAVIKQRIDWAFSALHPDRKKKKLMIPEYMLSNLKGKLKPFAGLGRKP